MVLHQGANTAQNRHRERDDGADDQDVDADVVDVGVQQRQPLGVVWLAGNPDGQRKQADGQDLCGRVGLMLVMSHSTGIWCNWSCSARFSSR